PFTRNVPEHNAIPPVIDPDEVNEIAPHLVRRAGKKPELPSRHIGRSLRHQRLLDDASRIELPVRNQLVLQLKQENKNNQCTTDRREIVARVISSKSDNDEYKSEDEKEATCGRQLPNQTLQQPPADGKSAFQSFH